MGILTEDAACNLRGDIVIFTLFVIVIFCNSHICVYGGNTVEKRVTFITVIKIKLHLFVNAVTF